ncbi:hypothetical protein [Mycobacterium sp.]|uniref:hypothetical protein n=1 Tax=Mycobacterium sp. TaxID=1785 RepID=UPI003BABB7A1
MTIQAWLDGDEHDLRHLAELFTEGDVRVIHGAGEGKYCLRAAELDNPPPGKTFHETAGNLVLLLNGLARTSNASYRPVMLSGEYTDGESQYIVITPKPANIRVNATVELTVTKPDGAVAPDPPPPWPRRLALAAWNPDVAEVLRITGRPEPLDWHDLYKIREIVSHAIRPQDIVSRRWANRETDSAFRASANRPDVSGSAARHARTRGASPKQTMTIEQGRSYISNLVIKWLDSLGET